MNQEMLKELVDETFEFGGCSINRGREKDRDRDKDSGEGPDELTQNDIPDSAVIEDIV